MSQSSVKRQIVPLSKHSEENQNIYGDFPAPELKRAKEVKEKMEEVEGRVKDVFRKSGRKDNQVSVEERAGFRGKDEWFKLTLKKNSV